MHGSIMTLQEHFGDTGCYSEVQDTCLYQTAVISITFYYPSIPLSFNLAAVLPRRDTYCVNSGTEGVDTSHT